MICSGPFDNVVYCLDYELVVSEVVLEDDPEHLGKRRIKSIASLFKYPPLVLGEVGITILKPIQLYDFGSPLTKGDFVLAKGKHQLQLVSIDIPGHKYLRNIDIVLVPKTHFGLAYAGLVTTIRKQNASPQSQEKLHKLFKFVGQRMIEAFQQQQLPFRDSP